MADASPIDPRNPGMRSDPSPTTLATYWTRVGELDQEEAESAWHWFIDRYRAFVRDVLCRFVGSPRADAATDEFWSYLFTSGVIAKADRSRRLRGFLVGVLRNFAHDWMRRHEAPRTPPDDAPEPFTNELHEDEEMRLWAASVLRHALRDMRRQWPDNAEVLCVFYGLPGPDGEERSPLSVTRTAERIDSNANAVHQALHRGRKRLRGCLEAELARLVGPDEVAEEIPLLMTAINHQSPGLTDPHDG